MQSANGVIENFFCKNVDIYNVWCTIFSIFSPLCNLMKKMPISCFTWRFTQSYHFFYFYLWGWFWLQHLLIAARIVKVPELLPFPNIFPNLKSEWIQYIIINSIQKLHVPFFFKNAIRIQRLNLLWNQECLPCEMPIWLWLGLNVWVFFCPNFCNDFSTTKVRFLICPFEFLFDEGLHALQVGQRKKTIHVGSYLKKNGYIHFS